MSELPPSAPGAHPSVRARYIGASASAQARPQRAVAPARTRPQLRAGRTRTLRAMTVEPVRARDPRAPEAAAEPWQPPMSTKLPAAARDGWAA